MTTLVSLPFCPPVCWFALLWQEQRLVLEAHEHYQKGSLRNRCYIAGPNGVQRLSVPLVQGKNRQQPIRDVRIAYDEPWQRQHWRSIRTAYGNAPYWEHFTEGLAPFFEKNWSFLFDFNLEMALWIKEAIACRGEIKLSAQYSKPDNQDGSDPVSSGPDHWPEWFHPAPYPQVFAEKTGFLPNLSALDLLFCCGKRAGEILEKSVRPS